jgi:hypothetical protein
VPPETSTNPCVNLVTSTFYVTYITGSITTIYPTASAGVNAHGVSIRFQSSRFSSTTISPPQNPNFTNTSTSSSNITSAAASHLSPGAEVGIGISVAIIILALLVSMAFWILRHRRAKAQIWSQNQIAAVIDSTPQELQGT